MKAAGLRAQRGVSTPIRLVRPGRGPPSPPLQMAALGGACRPRVHPDRLFRPGITMMARSRAACPGFCQPGRTGGEAGGAEARLRVTEAPSATPSPGLRPRLGGKGSHCFQASRADADRSSRSDRGLPRSRGWARICALGKSAACCCECRMAFVGWTRPSIRRTGVRFGE